MYADGLTQIYMKPNNFFSVTEARKNFFRLTDEVQKSGNHYTLTENGRPKAVLMSAEQFESWQETLDVMIEMPDLMDDVREYEEDKRTGAVNDYISFEDLLLKLQKKENELSNKHKGKGRKTNR